MLKWKYFKKIRLAFRTKRSGLITRTSLSLELMKIYHVILHDTVWACKRSCPGLHDAVWACKRSCPGLHDAVWACERSWPGLHDAVWACERSCMAGARFSCKMWGAPSEWDTMWHNTWGTVVRKRRDVTHHAVPASVLITLTVVDRFHFLFSYIEGRTFGK